MLEIRNDVPVPSTRKSREVKYPFAKLEVGQSFFVPATDTDQDTAFSRVYGSSQTHQRKLNRKFAVRRTTEDGVQGVYVGRTE